VWPQRNKGHKGITKFPLGLYHSQPNQLIERGSQTACNRKLGYHDSCTLCKGSAMYPRLVISSLVKRLEKPTFCHSYTSFGAWPRDHYMPLQMSTIRVCHALLQIPQQRALLAMPRISQQRAPLAPCGSARSQSMSHVWHKEWCTSPLNRARHTTYSIAD
jgi:hypothetical protein